MLLLRVRNSANGEDAPLGLVIQARRGVQVDHLIVLDCQVLTCALQMRNLHRCTATVTFQAGCRWLDCVCRDDLRAGIRALQQYVRRTCMKYPATMAFRMLL